MAIKAGPSSSLHCSLFLFIPGPTEGQPHITGKTLPAIRDMVSECSPSNQSL